MDLNNNGTILICEDNEIQRELLVTYLKEYYDILEAADGKEAWELIQQHHGRISAILTNLVMPNGSGYELLEQIQNNPNLQTMLVIVMADNNDLEAEEKCLKLGAVNFIVKPVRPDIVKLRIDNIMQICHSIRSLQEIEMDELTGVYSRNAFLYHVKQMIDANPDIEFDVLAWDIENFKNINLTYGSEVGDELLRASAEFMKNNITNELCGRIGSDVFAVLYPNSDETEIEQTTKDLIKTFVKQAPVANLKLKCGIYQKVDRSLSAMQICSRARLAIDSIKHDHSRCVAMFGGSISQKLMKSQRYESLFDGAIENKEFKVYYQPQYSPYTQKIVGAEALVRWEHEGKLLPPGEFLPSFEENRLIIRLDEYVFRSVCEYQRQRKERNQAQIPISVNISRQSLYQADLVEKTQEIMRENGLEPSDIPLEITESAAIGGEDIKPLADMLTNAGFSLHMDDFGTGQSSLSDLNTLSFDVLKLDKSLIDHIGDKKGEMLLSYIVALSRELNVRLIAEGVESKEQVEFLQKNHCDMIQGYYYSKPLPQEEFDRLSIENQAIEAVWIDLEEDNLFSSESVIAKRIISHIIRKMPGGFLYYEAQEGERILSSNEYLWKMFGCSSEEEFMEYVGGSFKGIVAPDELERVEESISKQIAENANNTDCVEYHIIRKDGKRIPVVDYGILDTQHGRSFFYVFISEADKK